VTRCGRGASWRANPDRILPDIYNRAEYMRLAYDGLVLGLWRLVATDAGRQVRLRPKTPFPAPVSSYGAGLEGTYLRSRLP